MEATKNQPLPDNVTKLRYLEILIIIQDLFPISGECVFLYTDCCTKIHAGIGIICERTYQKIKDSISSQMTFVHHDQKILFNLATDACNQVLVQFCYKSTMEYKDQLQHLQEV